METHLQPQNEFLPWIETLAMPIVLGLVAGGAIFMCAPKAELMGSKLSTIVPFVGVILGFGLVAVRRMRDKKPLTFHPTRKL